MFFLVFEGLDGSGKSTLMKSLSAELKNQNFDQIMTREPGGTALGDQLRELILSHKNLDTPTAKTELLLYQASRAQHVDKIIRPALSEKKWVLCDRFSASSIAFQGHGRGISNQDVEWLNQFSTGNLIPDLTILLDLSVEESQKRRETREKAIGEVADRIESENTEFHNRVRVSFLKQAQQNSKSWLVLDASKSPTELFNVLIDELKGRKWLA